MCTGRQASWREGGTICCKVEMKLALSKTERNLENVLEPWREEEKEEEEEEQKPPPYFLITSNKARY